MPPLRESPARASDDWTDAAELRPSLRVLPGGKRGSSAPLEDALPALHALERLRDVFGSLDADHPVTQALRAILDRLLVAAGQDPTGISLEVLLDPSPNAATYPTLQRIVVHRGVLTLFTEGGQLDVDAVAAVLAHEVVHLAHRSPHAPGTGAVDRIREAYRGISSERAADRGAIELLSDVGVDPAAYVRMLQRFHPEDDLALSSLLLGVSRAATDSHDAGDARILDAEERLEEQQYASRGAARTVIPTLGEALAPSVGGFVDALWQRDLKTALARAREPWQVLTTTHLVHRSRQSNPALAQVLPECAAAGEAQLARCLPELSPADRSRLLDLLTGAPWEESEIDEDDPHNQVELARFQELRGTDLRTVLQRLPELFPAPQLPYPDAPGTNDPPYRPLDLLFSTVSDRPEGALEDLIDAALTRWDATGATAWWEELLTCIRERVEATNPHEEWRFQLPIFDAVFRRCGSAAALRSNRARAELFRAVTRIVDRTQARTDLPGWLATIGGVVASPGRGPGAATAVEAQGECLRAIATVLGGSERGNPETFLHAVRATAGLPLGERAAILSIDLPCTPHETAGIAFAWEGSQKEEAEHDARYPADGSLIAPPSPPLSREDTLRHELEDAAAVPDDALVSPLQARVRTSFFWMDVARAAGIPLLLERGPATAEEQSVLTAFLASGVPSVEALRIAASVHCAWAPGAAHPVEMLAACATPTRAAELRSLWAVHLAWCALPTHPAPEDLEELARSVASLPPSAERNELLAEAVERSHDRAAAYELLRPLFSTEDRASILARLVDDPHAAQDVCDALALQGVTHAWEELSLGRMNAAAERAAARAWDARTSDAAWGQVPHAERVRLAVATFPPQSLARDAVLAFDTAGADVTEDELLLAHVRAPFARIAIGERLWSLLDPGLEAPLAERLAALTRAFPESSSARDTLLHDVLAAATASQDEVERAATLLDHARDTDSLSEEELLQRFGLARFAAILHALPSAAKASALRVALQEHGARVDRPWPLAEAEARVVARALLTGPEAAIEEHDFRTAFETFHLRHVLPPETIDLLVLRADLRMRMRMRASADEECSRRSGSLHAKRTIQEAVNNLTSLSLTELQRQLNAVTEGWKDVVHPSLTTFSLDEQLLLILPTLLERVNGALAPETLRDLPTLSRVFFALIDTLPEDRRGRVLARYIAQAVTHPFTSMGEAASRFIDCLGPVYVKAGQHLSDLGFFSPEVREQLIRFTHAAQPLDVPSIWHTLAQEGLSPDVARLGPLLGAASIRQAHLAQLTDGTQRVLKVQRPAARHVLAGELTSLERFVAATRADSSLLGGVVLPADLVAEVAAAIANEVRSTTDRDAQEEFRAHFDGRRVAGRTLVIPTIDAARSTPLVTVETRAPGQPLARTLDHLDSTLTAGLLGFLLERMLRDGTYHADPHPGNILASERTVALIDFGIVGHLSRESRDLFFGAVAAMATGTDDDVLAWLLAAHRRATGSWEELDVRAVQQQLQALRASAGDAADFQVLTLRLLNTLESAHLQLPRDLKLLIKTVGQLGYLLRENEDVLRSFLTRGALVAKLARVPHLQEAREHIRAAAAAPRTTILPARTLFRRILRPDITYELTGEQRFDPSRLSDTTIVMLPTSPTTSVGIVRGRSDYEVFFGGRWVPLAPLIFTST